MIQLDPRHNFMLGFSATELINHFLYCLKQAELRFILLATKVSKLPCRVQDDWDTRASIYV